MKDLLFLGEGTGPAFYVVGALAMRFAVTRVFGNERLDQRADVVANLDRFPVLVLSDYDRGQMSDDLQRRTIDRVQGGAGLLMIGGWSSFGGARGSWHGSPLAEILPVVISDQDDRTNTPLGTVLQVVEPDHPAVAAIVGREPCCVCGFNDVRPRHGAQTLIAGYELRVSGALPSGARFVRRETPMLAVWRVGSGRVAALAPDVSPHWAGGIVDWGETRVKLPTGAEVSDLYPAFLGGLCEWLAGD